jgi:hypothetical protein
MAYFLFIDESGQDHHESPYEVLAGIAVLDKDMGRLAREARETELRHFGRRYTHGNHELKGKVLLKKKVFQHAGLNVKVEQPEIVGLARSALDDGAGAGIRELKALALAKLAFVQDAFELCHKCQCRAFASIVETDAPGTTLTGLRKDYAYLFERFFYFLEEKGSEQGVVVFDELDKSQSHVLIDQMYTYFNETSVGRQRASRIVPEPFFVHSHLTTGVQFADLAAYTLSWGFRLPRMTKPCRSELDYFARQVGGLRHFASRTLNGRPFTVPSFAHITDLRTNLERLAEATLEEVGG